MSSSTRSPLLTRTLGQAALAVLLCMGCGSTTLLSQLPPAEQTKCRGTEPGWHALSPYFAVNIKSNGRAIFYHLRNPEDPNTRDAIGRQDMYWPNGEFLIRRRFGPRVYAYAVSQDGRSLLYFRDPIVLFGDPKRDAWEPAMPFGGQLHLYRHGLGDSLIVSNVDHWGSYGLRDSLIPAGAVVYVLPDMHGHRSMRGIWTPGECVVRSLGEFVPR